MIPAEMMPNAAGWTGKADRASPTGQGRQPRRPYPAVASSHSRFTPAARKVADRQEDENADDRPFDRRSDRN